MASRHLSRSLVLQTLFECDMQSTLTVGGTDPVQKRNAADPTHKDADRVFADSLLKGILGKLPEIDEVIVKAAPQWPLDKIAPIDRNVLRIGLFELLFSDRDAVPPKVALNEAIELAKSYGGDSSGKFVNGVLGAVYRSIGEPGKETAGKNTTPTLHEKLGGVLLATSLDGEISVALVHDAFGRWTLPKAKCMEGESPESAATRALGDELGVAGAVSTPLGEHEYLAHEPQQGKVARTVSYFLVCANKEEKLTCKICEGITDARWFKESELATTTMYPDMMPIIESGIREAKKLCQ